MEWFFQEIIARLLSLPTSSPSVFHSKENSISPLRRFSSQPFRFSLSSSRFLSNCCPGSIETKYLTHRWLSFSFAIIKKKFLSCKFVHSVRFYIQFVSLTRFLFDDGSMVSHPLAALYHWGKKLGKERKEGKKSRGWGRRRMFER